MPTDAQKKEMREVLLEQLAYLLHELEAMREVLDRVPVEVLEGRPFEGERSIKEMYGLIAASDREFFLSYLERIVAEDEPRLARPDLERLAEAGAWNERPMPDILDEIRAARERLLEFLRNLPPEEWERTASLEGERRNVYGVAHFVTQHDADLLRAAGYRFHETRLGDRDLPR